MLLFARVPHSSVLYIETELKVANFSLKVCREPWDEALLGHAVLKLVFQIMVQLLTLGVHTLAR